MNTSCVYPYPYILVAFVCNQVKLHASMHALWHIYACVSPVENGTATTCLHACTHAFPHICMLKQVLGNSMLASIHSILAHKHASLVWGREPQQEYLKTVHACMHAFLAHMHAYASLRQVHACIHVCICTRMHASQSRCEKKWHPCVFWQKLFRAVPSNDRTPMS